MHAGMALGMSGLVGHGVAATIVGVIKGIIFGSIGAAVGGAVLATAGVTLGVWAGKKIYDKVTAAPDQAPPPKSQAPPSLAATAA